jgi:hypothetical protein
MADPFLAWLESTAFSVWMRESTALYAFPGILALHTIGLGLIAGLNSALDLRLLGFARHVPPREFIVFLPLMWLGLWMNILSGVALLIAYPTKALTNPVFYLKLTLIAIALMILKMVLRRVREGDAPAGSLKLPAAASLACWGGAIVAGRLLAYTCTRLTIDTLCH